MRITLREYAELHGKSRQTVYMKYRKGGLKSARKEGIDIWIDEDEPYVDGRVKSGRYFGWRSAIRKSAGGSNKALDSAADTDRLQLDPSLPGQPEREGQSQKTKVKVSQGRVDG